MQIVDSQQKKLDFVQPLWLAQAVASFCNRCQALPPHTPIVSIANGDKDHRFRLQRAWRSRTFRCSIFLASWPECTYAKFIEDCRVCTKRTSIASVSASSPCTKTPPGRRVEASGPCSSSTRKFSSPQILAAVDKNHFDL